MTRTWRDIEPEDAVDVVLPHDGIRGPLNENGEECPWPWEPQQLLGAPLGQFHCSYCGGMQIAGLPHADWRDHEETVCGRCGRGPVDPMKTGCGEPDCVDAG